MKPAVVGAFIDSLSWLYFSEAVQVLLGMQFQDHTCLAKLDVVSLLPHPTILLPCINPCSVDGMLKSKK